MRRKKMPCESAVPQTWQLGVTARGTLPRALCVPRKCVQAGHLWSLFSGQVIRAKDRWL